MTALNLQLFTEKSGELANRITSLHFEHNPNLTIRYGEGGRNRCHKDAVYHLQFLTEALTMNLPGMYANYILWVAAMLKSRNIPETDLHDNLDFVQQAIHEIIGGDFLAEIKEYFRVAKEKLEDTVDEIQSSITDDNPLKEEVTTYLEYLLQGKRQEASILISGLIQEGITIKDIYQFIFQISQYEVGRLWQCNKITVAHEHYCTAATQQIMSGLYQHIFSTKRNGKTLVACSISGDLHELGIRMVTDFFEMDGWDTYYLGSNIPDDFLLNSLKEYKADILALSVTLPLHVSKAATLIKHLRENRDLATLKIMVGGYPFLTIPNLWQKVAADAFAENADLAVQTANNLVNP